VGVDAAFEIERFNRALSDFTGVQIECLTKLYTVPNQSEKISAVLVPRRGFSKPVKLRQNVGPYTVGSVFIRERHEARTAESRHLKMLYGSRTELPSESPDTVPNQLVHRSLPPSPATMREFIGRSDLLNSIWDWFIFSDQPRLYLHGPGGSGKTTLAFEFARTLADSNSDIKLRPNEKLDYVVFISGKETELDPLEGKQQIFLLNQFVDGHQQYSQVLFHSGMIDRERIDAVSEDEQDLLISELFNNFNGLIVIDDIDALTRKGVDTGEELLFLKAATAAKRTKILYTIRHAAAHAKRNSLNVPGLDTDSEFSEFIHLCADTFSVPLPDQTECKAIATASHQLPLLIETILGLRKFSGSYRSALSEFEERGGEEARRYLYQREYDRLNDKGKTRYLLAGLVLLNHPISVSNICHIFRLPLEVVRESINEAVGIFLISSEDEAGETTYQVTPPAIPFLRLVSSGLQHFEAVKRTVEVFQSQVAGSTPREAAIISAMKGRLRDNDYLGVIAQVEAMSQNDAALVNPIIQSLIGRSHANLGADHRERARDSFRAADAVGYSDVFMMRAWYHVEIQSGYGIGEAARLCGKVITNPRTSTRHRAEFLSKLAFCDLKQAESHRNTDREKYISKLKSSIENYLKAVRFAQNAPDIDINETIRWLDRPLSDIAEAFYYDFGQYLAFLESPCGVGHDIPEPAAPGLIRHLLRLQAPSTAADVHRWQIGIARTIGRIRKQKGFPSNMPGFTYLVSELDRVSDELKGLNLA
ncbi:MAG: ATP-binding protein, partial [Burkholderiales bacterium]|nr:ATP-binding protein [Burkholderiales bacterium]